MPLGWKPGRYGAVLLGRIGNGLSRDGSGSALEIEFAVLTKGDDSMGRIRGVEVTEA